MLINVVTPNKPKMLIGLSQKARGQESLLEIRRPQMLGKNTYGTWPQDMLRWWEA
ncbi:MAG: hypothetical protein AAGD96_19960 [Chloroflexota bacterium]